MTAKVLLLTALAACAYDARYEDCAIHCGTSADPCPDGLTCGAEGLCRTPGAPPACPIADGSVDGNSAAHCTNLAKTCGANGADDCCSTADPIPGGVFYRSYDVGTDGMYSSMSYPATVSPFKLDKYAVTVGRFREFVEAGGGTQAQPPMPGAGKRFLNGTADQGGWDASWNTSLATDSSALVAALKCDASFQTWTDTAGGNEALPINCVTWYEAFAFCVWDGGFLPTETEWNFAASGGSEQRVYPWSSPPTATTLDCTYANYSGCAGSPRRVGFYSQGEGRWKQADLAGNVWQWTLDWYQDPYSNPCTDCADMTVATKRANRGGSFGFTSFYLRTAVRGFEAPTPPHASIGVRCARY